MVIFHSGEEIIEMAIIIEERGFEFYSTYAKDAENEKIKSLFEHLADEEIKHKRTFQEFLENLKKEEFTLLYAEEDVDLYFTAIVNSRIFENPEFAIQLAKDVKNEIEAIDHAIEFEKDSILFSLHQ